MRSSRRRAGSAPRSEGVPDRGERRRVASPHPRIFRRFIARRTAAAPRVRARNGSPSAWHDFLPWHRAPSRPLRLIDLFKIHFYHSDNDSTYQSKSLPRNPPAPAIARRVSPSRRRREGAGAGAGVGVDARPRAKPRKSGARTRRRLRTARGRLRERTRTTAPAGHGCGPAGQARGRRRTFQATATFEPRPLAPRRIGAGAAAGGGIRRRAGAAGAVV